MAGNRLGSNKFSTLMLDTCCIAAYVPSVPAILTAFQLCSFYLYADIVEDSYFSLNLEEDNYFVFQKVFFST
jgi:hypothetical protein